MYEAIVINSDSVLSVVVPQMTQQEQEGSFISSFYYLASEAMHSSGGWLSLGLEWEKSGGPATGGATVNDRWNQLILASSLPFFWSSAEAALRLRRLPGLVVNKKHVGAKHVQGG